MIWPLYYLINLLLQLNRMRSQNKNSYMIIHTHSISLLVIGILSFLCLMIFVKMVVRILMIKLLSIMRGLRNL